MSSNPFARDGLVAGIALTLLVERQGTVHALPTRIEEITADRITVLSPMRQLRLQPNPSGTRVRAEYRNARRTLSFVTTVTGHDSSGNCEFLAMPAGLENAERRGAFRLPVSIRPLDVLRVVPAGSDTEESLESLAGMIVDLSEGGICLLTKAPGPWTGNLRVRFSLNESDEVETAARIVSADPPAAGNTNTQVHCKFTGLATRDRDRIARFILKQQLAMRQSGRL